MKPIPANECRIRVGGTLVALEAEEPWLARRLRRHFHVSAPAGDPDIRIVLGLERRGAGAVTDSLFEGKRVAPEGFTVGGGMIRGVFRRAERTAEARVDRRLFDGRLIRVFEQFLYMAFYSDPRNAGVILLHSSGVIHGGGGFLFTGRSGAGKSTVARLSPGDTVLNDEICLVRLDGAVARAESTPFNGFFHGKREGSAPLRCVCVLAHAPSHEVSPLRAAEAVACILPQIVPPIGLDECVTRGTVARMLDMAESLVRGVSVLRLGFRRDAGFWKLIDAWEGGR
jgi:hypothetical protein